MQNNNAGIFISTGYLTAISWAAELQPLFSIGASIGAMGLAAFGMINYYKKWKAKH